MDLACTRERMEEKAWWKKTIGRIYYAQPTSGEKYYLRMLLNTVKGCRSYEEIRTVDGVVHPTFKSACYSLGLLNDDKEWDDFIKEASIGPLLLKCANFSAQYFYFVR